jgi:hypothetical protein
MNKRAILAAVVYPMVNAVLFGFGAITVLSFFSAQAAQLLPIVIVASFVAAVPISWIIAPRLSLSLSAAAR